MIPKDGCEYSCHCSTLQGLHGLVCTSGILTILGWLVLSPSNRTHFHPITFLLKIHQLYDKVVEGTISETEYSMEDEAFSRLLSSCIHIWEGKSFFCTYDLEVALDESVPSDLLVEIDGVKSLQVDCLGP